QEEVALREHVAIGDGLYPAVADLTGIAHEIDELRMDRAFSAGQDDLVGVQLVAPALELRVDVVVQQVDVARRVRVETEHAAAVARRDEAHPVLPDVGRLLADQHPFRQLLSIHRSDLVPRCHPTAVPGQPTTAHGFPSRQLAKTPTGSEPHGMIWMRRPNATPNCGSTDSAGATLAASSSRTPICSHRQCGSKLSS